MYFVGINDWFNLMFVIYIMGLFWLFFAVVAVVVFNLEKKKNEEN